MNKHHSNQQIANIILGSGFVLFGSMNLLILLFGIFIRLTTPVRSPVAIQQSDPQAYIANQQASNKLMVSQELVAKKVDLQRKIFKVSEGQDATAVAALAEQVGATIVEKEKDLVVAKVPKENAQALEEDLIGSGAVASLEVDYPTFLAADNPDWGVVRIEAPEVWETTSAQGFKIAVIDTGIDYSHPDLSARFAGGYDAVNNDDDPADDHGHGTHVSGIIAADLNEAGLAGVAPQASIYAVKALAGDGTGYISDLVEAIDWAVDQNAAVINFSLGTSYDSDILSDKIREAAEQGVILVAAAGNTNGGSVLYPAAYDSVISVSATDSNDNFASFSSVGAELAAPGVEINSTVPGGGYAAWSGTSMAAPHVSATAALMMSNEQDNIRENLRNSAVDLGPSGVDNYFGHGLVHVKPATLGIDVLAPVVTFLEPDHNEEVSGETVISLKVQDESSLSLVEMKLNDEVIKSWEGDILDEQEEFEFEWQTQGLEEKLYTFIAVATDEYDNTGQAKIDVIVDHETEEDKKEATRSADKTLEGRELPDQSQAEENIPTQAPAYGIRGGDPGELRSEKRGDSELQPTGIFVPTEEPQEPEEKEDEDDEEEELEQVLDESEDIPEVSNSSQRNPTPANNSNSGRGSSNRVDQARSNSGRVRGVTTINWWQAILGLFR